MKLAIEKQFFYKEKIDSIIKNSLQKNIQQLSERNLRHTYNNCETIKEFLLEVYDEIFIIENIDVIELIEQLEKEELING